MSQNVFTFTCSKFFVPDCQTNPGGGDTGFIQTVVAASVCSVPYHDTVDGVASGAGMVAAIGGSL